jgi:hypothetical protein
VILLQIIIVVVIVLVSLIFILPLLWVVFNFLFALFFGRGK